MPGQPIRIAVQLHPQHGTYHRIRDAAVEAETLGYDVLYTWDHFFPLYGDPDGAHFECWSLLAAWAERTTSIRLGPLVGCNSYRNPELLAEIARTVDHISDGRVILGIGSGWCARDYREHGYVFGTAADRLRQLEAAVPRIRRRLGAGSPPPIGSVPLLIGGVGERITLRLVARHAHGWHALFPDRPEELEPKIAALRGWSEKVERDVESIEWGVGVEPDDLERFLDEDADTYVEMGFTQFTLGFNGPGWDVSSGTSWLAWRDVHNGAAD
jgi:probable F420-dependent oxidoreductase